MFYCGIFKEKTSVDYWKEEFKQKRNKMTDSLQRYFLCIESEKEPRIKVIQNKDQLGYVDIIRLSVADLSRCEISLFRRGLVVSAYGSGYRATWAPNCIELEKTFAPQEMAGDLLRAAYTRALQERGFDVSSPVGGMSTGRTPERLRNHPLDE